jgi:hypothetical protein
MYLCMYVSMYLCIYVSMYVFMYPCIHVSMYLCIYVSMYLCIHASMYPQACLTEPVAQVSTPATPCTPSCDPPMQARPVQARPMQARPMQARPVQARSEAAGKRHKPATRCGEGGHVGGHVGVCGRVGGHMGGHVGGRVCEDEEMHVDEGMEACVRTDGSCMEDTVKCARTTLSATPQTQGRRHAGLY